MTETMVGLRRKIDGAKDLRGVVRTMKAMAASNIGQYEQAVVALGGYMRVVQLGLGVCLRNHAAKGRETSGSGGRKPLPTVAIVIGSDQGLVGRFNEFVSQFATASLRTPPGPLQVYAVGERVGSCLQDLGVNLVETFVVPNSLAAVSMLVGDMLATTQTGWGRDIADTERAFVVFYNRSETATHYEPVRMQILPLDSQWQREMTALAWPSKALPQTLGTEVVTLGAFIREFLFISLFRVTVESLACENRSRLMAMERADRNIEELLDTLGLAYHRLRQNTIDEELFDVIAGYESLQRTLGQELTYTGRVR